MKKDEIFFGSEGLTSTSANHVCNLAKEYYQGMETILSNIQFYDTNVSLIGSATNTPLEIGVTDSIFESVPELMANIAEAKSLIAWLREAIKAKSNLEKEVKDLDMDEWCDMNNITKPVCPEEEEPLTEDEYYASLSLDERNRYLKLESEVATLGKYIHPDGAYAKARAALKTKLEKPHAISGSGRDAVIYSYTPVVSEEDVDDQFFKLQARHRDIQKQLNAIKHECLKAIEESATAAAAKYSQEYTEYRTAVTNIMAQLNEYKVNKCRNIRALKIVIPDSLKRIYGIINSLGK